MTLLIIYKEGGVKMSIKKINFIVIVREAGKIISKQIFHNRKKADKQIAKLQLKGLDVLFF